MEKNKDDFIIVNTIKSKDCVIYDHSHTICTSFSPDFNNNGQIKGHFSGTIEGIEDSAVQVYAQKYGYKFSALNDEKFTDIIEDGLKYRKFNDHCRVVGAITPSEDVSISSNIEGIPVTIIRDLYSPLIKSIMLPTTVDYFDNKAISSCSSLKSITVTNRKCKIYDSSLTICNYYSGKMHITMSCCIICNNCKQLPSRFRQELFFIENLPRI